MLSTLALRLYGRAHREDVILAANPLITDPDRIFVGQIIYLPVVPPAAAVPATGQGVVTPTRIGAV
jgi:nucleoid-associated protein YgaU